MKSQQRTAIVWLSFDKTKQNTLSKRNDLILNPLVSAHMIATVRVFVFCVWQLLCAAAYSTDHYTRTAPGPQPNWIYWLSYFPSTPEQVQKPKRGVWMLPWGSEIPFCVSWVICWLSLAPLINLKSRSPGGCSAPISICFGVSRSNAPPQSSIRPRPAAHVHAEVVVWRKPELFELS